MGVRTKTEHYCDICKVTMKASEITKTPVFFDDSVDLRYGLSIRVINKKQSGLNAKMSCCSSCIEKVLATMLEEIHALNNTLD